MATNTTARKSNRPKAVVSTISKTDALAIVKGGELNPNRYRRPCHLCEEIVDAGAGVLGGNKTEGWWAAHEGGKCFTPPKTRVSRKRPVVRKTDDFDEMVAAQIAESALKKTHRPRKMTESESMARAVEDSAAIRDTDAMVDEPKVPVRGTGKRNSTMAAAKKTVARRTTRKAAPAPAAKRPVKRTAPKKVTPNVPAEVEDESASDEEDGPEFAELDKVAKEFLAQVKTLIKNGVFDAALGELDDAIGERLDATAPAPAPVKKTTARKSTTPRATAADKVAPVKRTAKSSGSASVAKPSEDDEVEIVKVPKPRRGGDYQVNPKLKTSMAGVKITFKSYVAGTDSKKASVTLREEFNGKPIGTRVNIPTTSIVQDN